MPQENQMGVDSFQGVSFQRNFLWDVILPDIASQTGGLTGFSIGTLAQEISFGDYSIDSPNIMRVGPYQAYFAGLLSVQTIKITFLKTTPDVVAPYLYAWKQLMLSNGGLFQPKANYQKNIYIRFFDQTGNITEQYKCIGCFPVEFPQYQLDYGSNKLTTITPQFQVDKVEYSNNLA